MLAKCALRSLIAYLLLTSSCALIGMFVYVGSGRVYDLTLEHLKQLDFGSWWLAEFAEERIPTLREAICKCRDLSLHVFLEVKAANVREFEYEVCDSYQQSLLSSSSR